MKNLCVAALFALLSASAFGSVPVEKATFTQKVGHALHLTNLTYASDGSVASVQSIHNNQAINGDTITLPSGTFVWSSTLTVTKAITLQGNSTADPHCGGGDWAHAGACAQPFKGDPPPGTHVDNTKIMYNVTSKLIDWRSTGQPLQRITGVSILPNHQNQSSSVFEINGFPSTPLRVDNSFIGNINVVANVIWCNTYNFGVVDHVVSTCEHGMIQNGPGRSGDQGDSAFEHAVNWNGNDWFTIEDCWIKHGGDIVWGGKTRARYVHLHGETTQGPPCPGTIVGAVWVCHGTGRQGSGRGGRAYLIDSCDFHFNDDYKGEDGSDTGTAFWTNCTFTNNGKHVNGIALNCYRLGIPNYPPDHLNPPYFVVNGLPGQTWDYFATRQDGTHVDGEAPFVFFTGTSTSGSNGSLAFSGQNWQAGQWLGYVARRPDGQAAGITGNSTSALNLFSVGFNMGWGPNQQIQIVKATRYLDQTGVGWGDHINRASPKWPNQHLHPEPLYEKNNINLDNGQLVSYDCPAYLKYLVVEGRDFFRNTAPPGYVPFTYPHPLVSGAGTPTPSPAPSPTAAPSQTPQPTATRTPVAFPSPSPTSTATATATIPPTPAATPTATRTPTPSATATSTATASATATAPQSPSPSSSPIPTATATATSTATAVPTPTPRMIIVRPGETVIIQGQNGPSD